MSAHPAPAVSPQHDARHDAAAEPLSLNLARWVVGVAMLVAVAFSVGARAQVDPTRRDLVEFGYDQPIEGHAPLSAYVFYYLNRPQF
ncbi:MAG TPA: hypothetical protein VIF33_05950, partial [Casimicrobiaceae bacterium]